jgi:oligopeptide/dipeptide ABC transporter ATP-binding protein
VTTGQTSSPLLAIDQLEVVYRSSQRKAEIRAVDDVSFEINRGETLGLVGESGSGKSTIGRAILGLTPILSGRVAFEGEDIAWRSGGRRPSHRGTIQLVSQDPSSALNPARTIGDTLAETLRPDRSIAKSEVRSRVGSMLEQVGLGGVADRYPIEFSGGQRQRIAIARALMANPRLVVCDEPVSALDLSVQAQVLNLLSTLQASLGSSYLFVSHDLAVVRYVAHTMVVLYRGRVMESGPSSTVYDAPLHPYTQALLMASPLPDPDEQRFRREARSSVRATVVGVVQPLSCPYANRCPFTISRCLSERPSLEQSGDGRLVACHRWRTLSHLSQKDPQPPSKELIMNEGSQRL